MPPNGVSGVEVATEKAWDYCSDIELPAMIHLTKMDRERADFAKTLAEQSAWRLAEELGVTMVEVLAAGLLSGCGALTAQNPDAGLSPVNAIANDGVYVAPRIVRATVGPDGEVVDRWPIDLRGW